MPRATIPTAPQSVQDAAAAYRSAVEALEAAEAAKAAAGAKLLQAMQAAGLEKGRTVSGTVSVCPGRETIRIVCKALAKEIEAIRARSVRTGRGELNVGAPYVKLLR